MRYSGYIEGYYGRELSWEQRFALLDHLVACSMNTFLYAPKEDPYHRIQWKKTYPVSWQKKLRAFAAHGKRRNVTVVPALAPGLSFDYCSPRDYALLFKKFQAYFSMGITTVALLMDDIPSTLPSSSAHAFSSLGEAHGLLLKKLLADLKKENAAVRLWFCPTIYTDEFVKGKAVDSVYIKDLARTMPSAIPLMWTGPQVISETITMRNTGDIISLFNGNVIVWDNYYANDYSPYRLFVGPFTGREPRVINRLRGLLVNPTGLFHTDRFLLSLVADFLRNQRATVAGWERTAESFGISRAFYPIRKFFWSPFLTHSAKEFSSAALARYGDLYNDLIVPWQNPLKSEWHPYITGFNMDCSYLRGDPESMRPWIIDRYPPAIRRLMRSR